MRDGAWRVATGAAIGLAATIGLARLLAGLVSGVGTPALSRPRARRGLIRRSP
jgi:hypothetical protein